MLADEFDFLWSQVHSFIAEADAHSIPVPGQLELHDRCRCGVLPSPCLGALFIADQIVGMEELEIHSRVAPRMGFSHNLGRECNSESCSENAMESRIAFSLRERSFVL